MSKDEFYQAIMRSAVDPMVVINHEGTIVDLNDATLKTFKYQRDELINQKINMLMPEHDARQHDGYVQNYLDQRKAKIIGIGREIYAKRKDESLFACYLAVSDIEINSQKYFLGILRNIDSEKKVQQQLSHNYETLQKLNQWVTTETKNIQEKIVDFLQCIKELVDADLVVFNTRQSERHFGDVKTHYTSNIAASLEPWAEAMARTILGLQSSEKIITNRNELGITKVDNYPEIHQLASLPLISKSKWLGNLRFFWQDQSPSVDLSILRTCVSSFAVFIDLELTVNDLAIANDRFGRSQAAANIGTWDWNIATGHLFWSDQIPPLFGYPAGELETSYDNFITAVHPDDRDRVQQAVDDAIASDTPYDIDHRVVWPNGVIRWVNEKGEVTRDKNGKAVKMLGVVQDISREKAAEEDLINAKVSAEQANRAKSEFLSLMSHELRTPLNSVLGFSQLLKQESLTENQKLYVNQIIGGGNLLLKLVNDVLDLSKIETAPLKVTIEDVDLFELTGQCIELLAEQARNLDVSVTHVCDGKHPMVRADLLRLKQIILNLISNAIKYNKNGGTVDIDCQEITNNTLRMKVSDSGVGIDPARRDEVFQPFSRLQHKNSSIEGAGIGLLVTKKLVESMNGTIDFTSQPDEGSTFWIDIPVASGTCCRPEDKHAAQSDSRSLATIRLLYVEDNPSNISLMKSILEQQTPYQLIEAITAREGLELAEKEQPDLIIMDINLPDMSGIEACHELKNLPSTAQIPVIALTADLARQSENLVENSEFAKIIYKPFDLTELLDAIKEATA